jgi:carbon dioxide concentrating mechanism protein CcmN
VAVPAQASHLSSSSSIEGDVDLAPGVAIAPGVLLGAAPGCRLVIAAGVCLGADVVVQARQGDLVLEPGVSLGSGVLVVGHGSIGQHTCVGANSTVINPALGASQVVAPGTLVGDPSQALPGQRTQSQGVNGASNGYGNGASGQSNHGVSSTAQNRSAQVRNGSNGNASGANAQNGNGSSVYGKTQVNRLLATLFPHRQALNGARPEDRP